MPLNLLVFKEQLLIKDNNCTNCIDDTRHVFLMYAVSHVNEYEYMPGSCVVVYWTHRYGAVGLNPGQVRLFFGFMQSP